MSLKDNKKHFRKIFGKYLESGGKEGDRILDFGCGEGWSTVQGREMGLDVVGLDLDPGCWAETGNGKMEKRRREDHYIPELMERVRKDGEEPNVVLYDGKGFPFGDEEFDGLVCKTAMGKDFTVKDGNLIGKEDNALTRISEIYRVLKRKATVIIYMDSSGYRAFLRMQEALHQRDPDVFNSREIALMKLD